MIVSTIKNFTIKYTDNLRAFTLKRKIEKSVLYIMVLISREGQKDKSFLVVSKKACEERKAALLRSPGFATVLSYELGSIVGKKYLTRERSDSVFASFAQLQEAAHF